MRLSFEENSIWNDGYAAGRRDENKAAIILLREKDRKIAMLENKNRVLEYASSALLKERCDREIRTFMGIPIEKAMKILMKWKEKHGK